MTTLYKDFAPSNFDDKSNYMAWNQEADDKLQNWIVAPCGINKGSAAYEKSNFAAALELLGGESDNVQVHRFGHWCIGWYELILVHPSLKHKVDDIQAKLDNYPLLDEDTAMDMEFEAVSEYWQNCGIQERIDVINTYGYGECNIFASRRNEVPDIEYSAMGF